MDIRYFNESFENSFKYIDDKSVDLFFLDPPYYISGGKKQNINLIEGDRQDWDKQWSSKEEFRSWIKDVLSLSYKQLKDTGSIYVCISWSKCC